MAEVNEEEMSYQEKKDQSVMPSYVARPRSRREPFFSMWIISQEDLTVEINHFEGNEPEWLMPKRIICLW